MNTELCKKNAAETAVRFIKSGMTVGLGTGSTVHFAILKLADILKKGELKDIICIPTSTETKDKALSLGIQLSGLDEYPVVDITIDGADEVDEQLNLIKGGGGALLHEKIVAQASKELIIAVDENKISRYLFEKFPLPVEVFKFAFESEMNYLRQLGGLPEQRFIKGLPYLTDEGNYIIDVKLTEDLNIAELDNKLNSRAGIAGHGLFLNLCSILVSGSEDSAKIIRNCQVN